MKDNELRNWWGQTLDGGLFMGGLALVNPQTLLPSIVQGLHGPEWLVAMMPVLMTIGLLGPSMFTAHAIGGLSHFRPLLLWTLAFQRIPYLGAALVLLFTNDPRWYMVAVVMAPLLSGIFGGIGVPAWQQFFAHTISPSRRSSVFAWRFIIGSIIGVGSGCVVKTVLAVSPGQHGYGLLHLLAFLGLAASYASFLFIREPTEPAHREPEIGLLDNIRTMPSLLVADRRLFRLMMSYIAFGFSGAVVPYLAIHARHACAAPESFLGQLGSWQMAGAIVGGITAGWIGDRHGGKLPLQAGRLLFMAVCIAAPFTHSILIWNLMFMAFGAAFYVCVISFNTIQLDILPARGRANRLAVMSAGQVLITVVASLIGGTAWKLAGESAFPWLASGGAVALAVSFIIMMRLSEPRNVSAGTLREPRMSQI